MSILAADMTQEQKQKKKASDQKWRFGHQEEVRTYFRERAQRLYAAGDTNFIEMQRGNSRYARRKMLECHGLTEESFEAVLISQNGRCAICEVPFQQTSGRNKMLSPHVDHDHTTMVVRGLLCSNCNTMIGLANENPGVLARAIEYLSSQRGEERIFR
jgi:hypothetical protein